MGWAKRNKSCVTRRCMFVSGFSYLCPALLSHSLRAFNLRKSAQSLVVCLLCMLLFLGWIYYFSLSSLFNFLDFDFDFSTSSCLFILSISSGYYYAVFSGSAATCTAYRMTYVPHTYARACADLTFNFCLTCRYRCASSAVTSYHVIMYVRYTMCIILCLFFPPPRYSSAPELLEPTQQQQQQQQQQRWHGIAVHSVYSAHCVTMFYISVSWFCDDRASISLPGIAWRIGTDTLAMLDVNG